MNGFFKRWWWVLLAVAVVAGLTRLRFNVEILDLLPPEQPTVKGLKLYQEHFTNARELLITLRAPDAEKAETLAAALAVRLRQETNLVESVSWQPPWMEDPGKLAEILACLWLNQPPDAFANLTNRLAPDHLKQVLAETREALTTSLSPMDIARRAFDPFNLLDLPALTNISGLSMEQGQKMFASSEGTFRLLFVQARPNLDNYRACSQWLNSVRSVVADLRAGNSEWEGVVVRYTGRPVFVAEIASSMRNDLSGSVAGTAVIIAILFWLVHRRWLPMLWLLTLLALILGATLALGGLILGTISVLSMGFAAVLLGLAVDYAVVHYQEALAHPNLSVPEIRRAIAPSILWAATTTISAFLVLNLGGLPGLAQLGTLVAIGVALAALVMVLIYLPPLFPGRRKPPAAFPPRSWWSFFIPPQEPAALAGASANRNGHQLALGTTALLVLAVGIVLIVRRPGVDQTADALRPAHSSAQTALDEITSEMGIPQDAPWVVITGKDEREILRRLTIAERALSEARSNRWLRDFLLPSALWPNPDAQAANRPAAAWLGAKGAAFREAALSGGFTTNALFLTDELVRTWARAGSGTGVVWPTNEVSHWLLKRFVAGGDGAWYVMGVVFPTTNQPSTSALTRLSSRLSQDQILLSGWGLLGTATLARVQEKMWQVLSPMVLLVLASLWFAFRRSVEVCLGLAVLVLSGLSLLAVMGFAGWSWNLLNLMALPLILGTGVDYSIFMQLGLRRHGGDVVLVRQSIGRALLLCGGTAIAGFGSLAWSGNPGMASLGKVCAIGIGANVLFAVFLLPAWWSALSRRARTSDPNQGLENPERLAATGFGIQENVTAPSAFYRAWLWRLGIRLIRILPAWSFTGLCLLVAELYFQVHRRRREVVIRNLLPVVGQERAAAEKTARALYRQFALKMMELWRFESGVCDRDWFTAGTDWGLLEDAIARKKGVLLLTPHLGNWELGGALLTRRGINLVVLTQAEPGEGLTEMRQAARAKWGIETFVVGSGGFDFVEIIKRLQDGANVALLIDRPPAAKAATVELFRRPFLATLAAAELARASGCALLGVVVIHNPSGYSARILPEFRYDRQALGHREARLRLTQEIMSAFEPEIREHPDQWFHFVPIWPEDGQT